MQEQGFPLGSTGVCVCQYVFFEKFRALLHGFRGSFAYLMPPMTPSFIISQYRLCCVRQERGVHTGRTRARMRCHVHLYALSRQLVCTVT